MSDYWNWFDQLLFITCLATLFIHWFGDDLRKQLKLGSIALFFVYLKFFYWMRIFDSTAAFLRMLKEIIIDIIPFLIFLLICIGMFANPMVLLD
jgi:hypothetical protein